MSYLTWTTNLSVPCPSGLKPAGRTSAPQWSAAGSEYPFAERDLGSRPAMRPYDPPTAMGGGRKAGTAVHRRGGQWQLTEAGMVAVVACTTPVASLVPRHQPRPTGHPGPAPRTHRLGHRLAWTPAPPAHAHPPSRIDTPDTSPTKDHYISSVLVSGTPNVAAGADLSQNVNRGVE